MRPTRILPLVLAAVAAACSSAAAPEQVTSTPSTTGGTTTTAPTVAAPDADPVILYRINAGGPEIPAVDGGPPWTADQHDQPSPFLNLGVTSSPVTIPVDVQEIDPSVPDTTPAGVFEWERWDEDGLPEMGWSFPVDPAADVEVRLFFASAFDGASQVGDRVFDVTIDGVPVLPGFDIVAEAGHGVGTMRSVRVTADGDGLDLEFRAIRQRPEINAIEVIQHAAGEPVVSQAPTTTLPSVDPVAQDLAAQAVQIAPGEDIQAYVDSHPEGATFLLGEGTFSGQTVRPRNRQSFYGTRGPGGELLTILDGGGVAGDGFVAGGASGVTISGLALTGYTNGGVRTAAINGRFPEPGRDWVIENCDVGYSSVGINAGPGARVAGNVIHHNELYGLTGQGDGILVQGNEIASNRTDTGYDAGDSSATKFVLTTNLVVRDNWVHHNNGHGIWTDINNLDALIVGNRVEDNWWVGIFHEISYRAVIRNNLVVRNGLEGYDQYARYGIMITNSPDVEVYGNVLIDNGAGIGSRQWDHPGDHGLPDHDWRYGERVLKNLDVHDNTVVPEPT